MRPHQGVWIRLLEICAVDIVRESSDTVIWSIIVTLTKILQHCHILRDRNLKSITVSVSLHWNELPMNLEIAKIFLDKSSSIQTSHIQLRGCSCRCLFCENQRSYFDDKWTNEFELFKWSMLWMMQATRKDFEEVWMYVWLIMFGQIIHFTNIVEKTRPVQYNNYRIIDRRKVSTDIITVVNRIVHNVTVDFLFFFFKEIIIKLF